MTDSKLPISEWVKALEEIFIGIARDALGHPVVEVRSRHAAPPPDLMGAYVGIVGPEGAFQIGVSSDANGLQSLSKALLGMTAEDPPISDAEMADAFCEIVNIFGGNIKRSLHGRVAPMEMGLPVFFRGPVQATDRVGMAVIEVRMDQIDAALVLLHPVRSEPKSS